MRNPAAGLAVTGVLLALAPVAQPAPYFVATNGLDSNPGTYEAPWRTIQKAADTAMAGDAVSIRSGTYRERVIPQNSGMPGNPIVFSAATGATVVVDGSLTTLPDDLAGLFEVAGRSHIVIRGLQVINSGPYPDNAGFLIMDSSDITLSGNRTSNTCSSGIGVWWSARVIVESNMIERACNYNHGPGAGQEGISMAGTDTFEVRGNRLLDCRKEGICLKDGSLNGRAFRNVVERPRRAGIYVDAWDKSTTNIWVFQNIVHDSEQTDGIQLASEMGGLLSDVVICNNIAYHNRYCGLAVTLNGDDPSVEHHPMDGVLILNNTFADNGWTEWGGGINIDNPDALNVVVRNNICSSNLYFQIAVTDNVLPANVSIDHNLIDGFRGTEGETRGSDYIEGSPRFVNAFGADFHLRIESLAIDAGATNTPPADFDGISRPQDGNGDGIYAADIGAFEFQPPLIQGIGLDPTGGLGVSWQSYSGGIYRISSAPELNPADWSPVGSGAITARSATATAWEALIILPPKRFYRISQETAIP